MRNLLALGAAALLTFAAAGWYLGWYQIKAVPDKAGHEQVTIDFNGPKIGEDLGKGKAKLKNIMDGKGGENSGTAVTGGQPAPAPAPWSAPAPAPAPAPPPPAATQWSRDTNTVIHDESLVLPSLDPPPAPAPGPVPPTVYGPR